MNDVKSRSARAGTWLGLLGPELTLLLPGREKPRAAQLWTLLDDGARFEVVLDQLLADGLTAVPEFVLVAAAGGSARVLVRGSASVSVQTADGPREVTAGDLLWAEESFTEVTSVVATLPDSGVAGPEVPVVLGLARVGQLTWGSAAAGPVAAPEPTVESSGQPPRELTGEPTAGPLTQAVSVPEPAPADGPAAGSDTGSDAGPPEWPAPRHAAEVPEDQVAVTGEHPAAAVPPEVPAAVPAESPVGAADYVPSDVEHDGMTQIGAHPLPPPPPGIPGQPQAPSVTSRPVARLVFSHGTSAEVDRAILVGRAPEARRFAPGDQPELVTVPSPHQEVSSTHLEIRPGSGVDHGMAVATDLGSTNGTLLVQPGLPPEELQPGIAVSLNPGAIIDLGDGVTIQVTKP